MTVFPVISSKCSLGTSSESCFKSFFGDRKDAPTLRLEDSLISCFNSYGNLTLSAGATSTSSMSFFFKANSSFEKDPYNHLGEVSGL